MPEKILRIGTRESQLALWQANKVKDLLEKAGYAPELVPIKSEGDINLTTPLYEMGVQGIFTRSLDIALLEKRIDLAVHSQKDVPTRLPAGIVQTAVLERASYKDVLVPKQDTDAIPFLEQLNNEDEAFTSFPAVIATSSIRRRAQWLHRYPQSTMENLRGNVNTRLKKLAESQWHGAIFAAAGLQRIGVLPDNAIELDWMLPAPAQGAIVVVCGENDAFTYEACQSFHHLHTALCTQAEKDFLRTLMGGCSTPISALAQINDQQLFFQGSILTPDGKEKAVIEKTVPLEDASTIGTIAAEELLANGGRAIAEASDYGKK
ncbi:hydroxymethylbilane synthase [Terrimonas ferruginea]|uniref:hydroxymethylbilane synthase n=1 Tax=Terrimonas ferruginea TaxID=249 RepID=UPI000427B3D9|nr:hydroxymethylbilane synthase [Terrimonas ferruginea]